MVYDHRRRSESLAVSYDGGTLCKYVRCALAQRRTAAPGAPRGSVEMASQKEVLADAGDLMTIRVVSCELAVEHGLELVRSVESPVGPVRARATARECQLLPCGGLLEALAPEGHHHHPLDCFASKSMPHCSSATSAVKQLVRRIEKTPVRPRKMGS